MTVNELFELATKDPENGVGSTSRLRLAHGVLYYKDDSKFFYPMFAYMGDYLLNFTNCTPWGLKASMRTQNMVNSPIRILRENWAARTASLNGKFQDDTPAVVVDDASDSHTLAIKKPGPTTAKMLAMGIHPENGKTRAERMNNSTLSSVDGDLRLAFFKAFEYQLRWLAYGAIRRENSLRDMANLIGQMKLDCDKLANDVVGEMSEKSENHFAPLDYSSAGTSGTHLEELAKRMDRFGELSQKLHRATTTYAEVSRAVESIIPRVDTETWGVMWDEKVGFAEPRSWMSGDQLCETGYAPFSRGTPHFKLQIPGMSLVDYNARSLSYYWVRRNFLHYQSILGRLNFIVPKPFDQAPEEWEYTELAAPLFASTDQK